MLCVEQHVQYKAFLLFLYQTAIHEHCYPTIIMSIYDLY